MKKSLLSVFAVCTAAMAVAQCNQLFISEYVVGTGNNKAYELYNPTASPIDLNGYVLQRWSNGEQSSTDETILAGTIQAYGTWVVTNGQTEDINLGTFISPAIDPVLHAMADQWDNPYPAPTFMNGNDALLLVLNGTIICDIFGKPGEDPGQAWAAPDGTFITDNQTMVRKFNVTQGVVQPPIAFLPLAQYDTLGTNNWTNLGLHDCACFPLVSNNNTESLDVKIYPNPVANNDLLKVKANYAISKVELFDLTGRLVSSSFTRQGNFNATVDTRALPKGAYIINVMMENNGGFSSRIVKN